MYHFDDGDVKGTFMVGCACMTTVPGDKAEIRISQR